MRYVFWDSETHLIKRGLIAPKMVCLTFAEQVEQDLLGEPERVTREHQALVPSALCEAREDVSTTTGQSRGTFVQGIMLRADAITWLRAQLLDPGVTIVGHNVWFDLGVAVVADSSLLPLIFAKLEAGLVHDTQVRQQLIDIATGEMKFFLDEDGDPQATKYDLAAIARRLLNKHVSKKDSWRLKYALLDGVPLSEWPAEALFYAINDAVTTGQIHAKQDEIAGGPIPNSIEQHRAAWALHLMSMWGVRTDGPAVEKLKEELTRDFSAMMTELRPSGLLKIIPARLVTRGALKGTTTAEKVTKNMAAIKDRVTECYTKAIKPDGTPGEVPLSESGKNVSTNKKTLTESGDTQLKKLAEAGAIGKLLNTYVPVLESGTQWPICPRYNVLVETGRTSCSNPNIQNPPRAGGVRNCFVPRDGWVYAFSDYDTLELRALAQVCLDILGQSKMADALRAGQDLHLSLAAEMAGLSYERAKELYDSGDNKMIEDRQFCKIPNFGLPGGLGADTFVAFAEGYGAKINRDQAVETIAAWRKRWTEMEAYFAWVNSLTDTAVTQIRSGRVRGGAGYCAIANGFFQGLAADGAKEALWLVAKECYLDQSSPLFGCRPCFFLHDEIGIEIPRRWIGASQASTATKRLSEVMIEAMKKWIPDIPIFCSPYMVRRWYKGAKAAKVNENIVPCKPSKQDGKTTWIPDLDEVDERIAA